MQRNRIKKLYRIVNIATTGFVGLFFILLIWEYAGGSRETFVDHLHIFIPLFTTTFLLFLASFQLKKKLKGD